MARPEIPQISPPKCTERFQEPQPIAPPPVADMTALFRSFGDRMVNELAGTLSRLTIIPTECFDRKTAGFPEN